MSNVVQIIWHVELLMVAHVILLLALVKVVPSDTVFYSLTSISLGYYTGDHGTLLCGYAFQSLHYAIEHAE